MPETRMPSVRLKPEIEQKLARLSKRTHRTAAALGADAIASYIDRENTILDGIARGLDDMKAGLLVPHGEAMDELDAVIAAHHRPDHAALKRTREHRHPPRYTKSG